MTGTDTTAELSAVPAEQGVAVVEAAPELHQDDSVVTDLWDIEENLSPGQNEGLNASDSLKFELETLTIEKERLKKENRRLAEMLETIQLEEELASLKKEVSTLGGENEQLLAEIQRRRQAIGKIA